VISLLVSENFIQKLSKPGGDCLVTQAPTFCPGLKSIHEIDEGLEQGGGGLQS
jgi:hypothetical protein